MRVWQLWKCSRLWAAPPRAKNATSQCAETDVPPLHGYFSYKSLNQHSLSENRHIYFMCTQRQACITQTFSPHQAFRGKKKEKRKKLKKKNNQYFHHVSSHGKNPEVKTQSVTAILRQKTDGDRLPGRNKQGFWWSWRSQDFHNLQFSLLTFPN